MNYVIYTTAFLSFLTILFIYIRNRNHRRNSKRRSTDINQLVHKAIEHQKEEKKQIIFRRPLKSYNKSPRQMTEVEKRLYNTKPDLTYWYRLYSQQILSNDSGIIDELILNYENIVNGRKYLTNNRERIRHMKSIYLDTVDMCLKTASECPTYPPFRKTRYIFVGQFSSKPLLTNENVSQVLVKHGLTVAKVLHLQLKYKLNNDLPF